MLKKLGVIFIALLSTFSVVYAMNQEMFAADSTTYRPYNLNYTTLVNFANKNSSPLSWVVIANDYPGKKENSNYISLIMQDSLVPQTNFQGTEIGKYLYGESYIKKEIDKVFNDASLSSIEKQLIKKQKVFEPSTLVAIDPSFESSSGSYMYLPSANELLPLGYSNNLESILGQGLYCTSKEDCSEIFNKLNGGSMIWTRTYRSSVYLDRSVIVHSSGTEYTMFNAAMSFPFNVMTRLDRSQIALATPLTDDKKVSSELSEMVPDQVNELVLKNESVKVTPGALTKTEQMQGDDIIIPFTLQGGTIDNTKKVMNVAFSQIVDGEEIAKYVGRVKGENDGTLLVDTNNIEPGKYMIRLYYEEINAGVVNYNLASEVSSSLDYTVLPPLKDYTYSITPQADGSTTMDYLVTSVNANKDSQIAITKVKTKEGLTLEDPTYDVNYEIIKAEGSSEEPSLTFKNGTDGNTMVDSGNNAIIYAETDLLPGIYKFRVRAYDDNNSPSSSNGLGIDKDGNEVANTSPGLISDEQSIIVYPNKEQLSYTQYKNEKGTPSDTSDDEYYSIQDINAGDLNLGLLEFESDAHIQELNNEGYVVDSVELLEKGKSTPLSQLKTEADVTNPNKYFIKKNGTVTSGSKNFDVKVTFKNENENKTTAILVKADQTFFIAPELKFKDPDKAEFLDEDTYTKTFDPTNQKNDFALIATDNENHSANSKVKYCLVISGNCDPSTSAYLTLKDNGNGTSTITAKGPGSENRDITIRAYLENDASEVVAKKDIVITIQQPEQTLAWSGKDVQSTGNNITKTASGYALTLKYDDSVGATNEVATTELYNSATLPTNTIGLSTNLILGTGIKPNITYKITPNNPGDAGKVSIANGKLSITGKLSSDVVINASGGNAGDYAPTSTNPDKSVNLTISVSDKPKVQFTPAYTNSIIVGDAMASGTAKLGDISLKPATTGYTYAVEKVEMKTGEDKDGNPIYTTLNTNLFAIKNTKELWRGSSTLATGKYLITLKASNAKGEEAVSYGVSLEVKDASFVLNKIQWLQKSSANGATASPVLGYISESDKINTGKAKAGYKENDFFTLSLADISPSTQLQNATFTYELSEDSTTGYITVSSSGVVTILKANEGSSDVVKVKATISKTGYEDLEVYVPIEISKAQADFIFTKQDGTPYSQNAGVYPAINATYAKDGTIDLFTNGLPSGADVTITIKSIQASTKNDVLQFNDEESNVISNDDAGDKVCKITSDDYKTNHFSKCQPLIQNAMIKLTGSTGDKGKIIVSATSSATDGYAEKTIEMAVNVLPAEQTKFDFSAPIEMESNTTGSFTPTFKDSPGTGLIVLYTEDMNNEISDFSEDELMLGQSDPTSEGFFNNINSYDYNIVVATDSPTPREGRIFAQKLGDRNYKASPMKETTLTILPEGQSSLQLTMKSYEKQGGPSKPKVSYGDEYFELSCFSPDDTGDIEYSFKVDPSSLDKVIGHPSIAKAFQPVKATGNNEVTILVTRTDTSTGLSQTTKKKLTVYKRKVALKVEDVNKKVGMKVLPTDFKFTTTSGNFLTKDIASIGNAIFTSKNSDAIEVVSMDGVTMAQNNQVIKASFPTTETLSNYEIVNVSNQNTVGIEQGKILVTQDSSEQVWVEKQPTTDTALGKLNWYNGNVDILLKAIAGNYDEISLDGIDWQKNKVTVVKEGINNVTISFRQSAGSEIGAIALTQKLEVKIDETAPEIKSITGTPTNKDALSKLMHALSFGNFFKPGTKVNIDAVDIIPAEGISISEIDRVEYEVFAIDKDGVVGKNPITTSSLQPKETFALDSVGTFRVCAIAYDNAGNPSTEKCSDLNIKKIDVDVDKDGNLDFIDSNDDGCPDINIDANGDNIVDVNIDRNKDKVPDLNIDTKGEGTPQLNIDTDEDGKPDLNLVYLEKWTPTTCVEGQKEAYCTMSELTAELNVDITDDAIPDINIDTDGDGKADLNITKPNQTKPYLNILPIHQWTPIKDNTFKDNIYDTMEWQMPFTNYDSDKDGKADINIDLNDDGTPDLNIDSGYDGLPDFNIDGDGDGKADINIDENHDGIIEGIITEIKEWIPDLDMSDLEYDTMKLSIELKNELEDNGIVVEKPDGTFLPNYALKVDNVIDSIKEEEKAKIQEEAKDQEIKAVYEVHLLKDEVQVNPDGTLKVKIPVMKGIKNPKLVLQQKDGSYKTIEAKVEGEYYVYETDFLGNVSVIGDKETSEDATLPDPQNPANKPNTSVQGNYVGGIGGAGTGDFTNILPYVFGILITTGLLFFIVRKRRKEE